MGKFAGEVVRVIDRVTQFRGVFVIVSADDQSEPALPIRRDLYIPLLRETSQSREQEECSQSPP